MQIGLWNVVSVPDGAPSAPAGGGKAAAAVGDDGKPLGPDRKFSYLQTCEALLQSIEYANEACSLPSALRIFV